MMTNSSYEVPKVPPTKYVINRVESESDEQLLEGQLDIEVP